MNRTEITLRADATFGLKVRPGDKIRKGQHINTNREKAVTSPVSGTVKSVRFDPNHHEFLIVISPGG
jgi:Na+-translocating ferredoxin:NAD+ oxidoreductase RnfC subunit